MRKVCKKCRPDAVKIMWKIQKYRISTFFSLGWQSMAPWILEGCNLWIRKIIGLFSRCRKSSKHFFSKSFWISPYAQNPFSVHFAIFSAYFPIYFSIFTFFRIFFPATTDRIISPPVVRHGAGIRKNSDTPKCNSKRFCLSVVRVLPVHGSYLQLTNWRGYLIVTGLLVLKCKAIVLSHLLTATGAGGPLQQHHQHDHLRSKNNKWISMPRISNGKHWMTH